MKNEKRLIDANTLAEKVWNISMYIFGVRNGKTLIKEFLEKYRDSVMKEIANAPIVDAVEVVRCKDCKHGIVDACTNRLLCARCGEIRPNGHVWGGCSTIPENFCSYGERGIE